MSRLGRRGHVVTLVGCAAVCAFLTSGLVPAAGAAGLPHDDAPSILREIGDVGDGASVSTGEAEAFPEFDTRRTQESGVSVDQVRAADASGAELGALAAGLEGAWPEIYVQSEWRYDDYPNAQVVFSEEPPAAADQLLAAASFPIDVVVQDGGPDRCEAMEIVENMQDILTGDTDRTSIGSYDPLAGSYSVTVDGARPNEDVIASVEALAQSRPVHLEFGENASGAEPAYIGGEGGLYGCTAGFVVRNGPTFGISTANHCPVPGRTFSYLGSSFAWGGSLDRKYGDAE